ncbi:MAG: leucine-rich repeat domain-containing protein, partial [Clostridiales bacterium]|nr:leucine-rich repeat domain-containing protein [Clostridiales bacterium]
MKLSEKLILSVFFIFIMCIGVFVAAPSIVSVADVIDSGTCGDNLTWVLTSDGVLTVSGEGEMKDYSGANTGPWHSYCESIISIVIENGVTSIGRCAFWDCTGLISVTIGNGVTTIDYQAFHDCTSLTSITIPDSVTSIGSEAFENCTSLESITLPDNATTIARRAFYNTAYYNDLNNWTEGVLYIDNWLIEADSEVVSGGYTIKSDTVGIASEAFSWCESLTSVTIPDSVTSIGGNAFSHCTSLTSMTIPDSVTKIGDSAFYNCESLTSVKIGDGVTEIGDDAFANCTSLIEIYFEGDAPSMRNGGWLFGRVTATAYYPAEN